MNNTTDLDKDLAKFHQLYHLIGKFEILLRTNLNKELSRTCGEDWPFCVTKDKTSQIVSLIEYEVLAEEGGDLTHVTLGTPIDLLELEDESRRIGKREKDDQNPSSRFTLGFCLQIIEKWVSLEFGPSSKDLWGPRLENVFPSYFKFFKGRYKNHEKTIRFFEVVQRDIEDFRRGKLKSITAPPFGLHQLILSTLFSEYFRQNIGPMPYPPLVQFLGSLICPDLREIQALRNDVFHFKNFKSYDDIRLFEIKAMLEFYINCLTE